MREENIFGIPMNVGTEAELREEARKVHEAGELNVYLVVQVTDSIHTRPWPALAARRRHTSCSQCREICWLDPLSYVAPEYMTIICTRCFKKHLDSSPPAG